MGLQDARDRRSSCLVPEISEGTLDPRVSPRRIFLRHAEDQLLDLGPDTTTGVLSRIGPPACHQLPMPSQQRVGADDRRELTQGRPTQPVGPSSELPTVGIREPQPPLPDLPPEEAILFDQIRKCRRSRRSRQPVMVRSSNRRTDRSITGGRLYHIPTNPAGVDGS